MANSTIALEIALNPVFNAQMFNAIINSVKTALGELGKDIKPIDEAKFQASWQAAKMAVENNPITVPPVTIPAPTVPKPDTSSIPPEGTTAATGFKEKFISGLKGLDDGLKGSLSTVLGVFGGEALLGGVKGLVGGFGDIIEAGKKSFQTTQNLSIAFAQAGKSGTELNAAIAETGSFAADLSNKFAMPISAVRSFSQTAAAIGGATGQANKDLTELAIGIEKASNGMVSGDMAIRIFSKGVSDPESQFALGRLTKQFPALGTAMKDIKNPADATQAALSFFCADVQRNGSAG